MQQQSTMAAAAAVPVRKGLWTKEEDQVLVNHVAAHGAGSWSYLARAAGLNRTGASCRQRWLNYLRPGLRRGKMTPEEQDFVLYLHSLWGNKWTKIARHIPGRTDNDVKNFWRSQQAEKLKKRQHVIAAAGQGRSSGSNSGGSVDDGIVAHQPSMWNVEVLALAAAGDTNTSSAAAAMDMVPELLATSGENFWGIHDYFWSTTLSWLVNNHS